MRDKKDLQQILARIDGRGYKAYKDLQGAYGFGPFTLYIDHVQGDPFASPSKVRVRVPQSLAQLPDDLFQTRVRQIALEDSVARQVHRGISRFAQGSRGTDKSGLITVDAGQFQRSFLWPIVETVYHVPHGETLSHTDALRPVSAAPAFGRDAMGQAVPRSLLKEKTALLRASLRR